MRSSRSRWWAVPAITIALLLGVREMAFAHTTLLRSEPAAGSRSATSPERVRLVFSEALEPSLAQLSIVDVAGSVVRLSASGDPHDVNAIVAPLSALAPGSYRLRWRVVSADGHPVEGSFTFSVGVESAAAMAPPVPLPADEESIVWGPSVGGAPLIPAALRGVALGTLMALAGVLSFIAWPRSTDRVVSRRANRVAMVCAVAAPLLLVLHFGAWAMNADAAHQLSSESLSAALATSVGRVELWRTGFALLALWAMALARRPGLALPFAVAALVVSGATGHAAAISPLYATPAKALHLVAAALWAGGLLWLLCLDRQDVDQFIRETLRVSSVALAGVVIVMLSGIVQTLLFLPTLSDLLTSAYGALVLAKVFGMLILIAFGAHHRFRVLPLLRSDAQSPTRLVVTVRREVVVFGVVVLLGGLLAYVPPALHSASHAAHSHIISP